MLAAAVVIPITVGLQMLTLSYLFTFRGYLKQVLRDSDPFITKHRLGGRNFEDTLSYHPIVEEQIGLYHYVMAGQLISYILRERTGMIPEDWGKEKVFPHLNIESDDYDWIQNWEGVNLAFHGLRINIPAMSKIGSLYLQVRRHT